MTSRLPAAYTPQDRETLARTLWGEARGEIEDTGPVAFEAVAWVVRTRAAVAAAYVRRGRRHPLFGDGSVRSACLSPWQFSCWNAGDPNLPRLLAVTDRDALFRLALGVASAVLDGAVPDPTGGADHYVVTSWVPRTRWAAQNPDRRTAVIGRHSFYRLG